MSRYSANSSNSYLNNLEISGLIKDAIVAWNNVSNHADDMTRMNELAAIQPPRDKLRAYRRKADQLVYNIIEKLTKNKVIPEVDIKLIECKTENISYKLTNYLKDYHSTKFELEEIVKDATAMKELLQGILDTYMPNSGGRRRRTRRKARKDKSRRSRK